ncbi:tyrosine-type recombinase/integrase [Sphingopyxis sp. 113P3]|uniref:tyrosine-type recombinase/integrase n=1 Tax=Sphingopyxis sp. (strain 113P3) TaxID=292913 RepID=UPI00130E544C|nr:tyrosine-type recombinase/integrase [Sphingopyxis sp. 113P3]
MLAELIMSLPEIPLWKRRELCSAIRNFAKVCGLTPDDIIADPGTIRTLRAKAPWLLAGYTKGSWANILSRLNHALEIGGVKVHRQRRNFKPNSEWEQLLAPLCRRDRDDIHRFAGWCSIREISPHDVSPAIFDPYYAYLDQQMTQTNPRERGHVARRAWNRAIAVEGSSYQTIPAPNPIGKRLVRWEDFPQSLQDELRAYGERMLEDDPFDEEHRPIKPVTLDNYHNRIRAMLTTLVDNGMSPDDFPSLATVVDPATVKRAFELRLDGRPLDDKARMDLHGITTAVLSIARYLDLDKDSRARLKQLAKKVRFKASGMCEKNRERLIPLFDPSVRTKLLNLPLKVADDLRAVNAPTVRQAQRMQMATLLDLLLHVPMRIRNPSELDLATTIIPPIAGSIGGWRISIPACEVKNQWAIDAQLGEELGAVLDRYVNVFRSVLMKGPTSALFVGQRGARKGSSNLSKQLARFVRREIGVVIHAHLMRHLAAHLYLLANPGDYETVRRLLGHKNIETTIRFYEGLLTDDAFARYDGLIEEMRSKDAARPSKPSSSSITDDFDEGDLL